MIPSELLRAVLGGDNKAAKELGLFLDSLLWKTGASTLQSSSVGPIGGAAPYNAQYVTLATDTALSKERVLTPAQSISGADGGANGAYTLKLVNDSASPGNLKVYGTNASGTKGWRSESAPSPANIGEILVSLDGATWTAGIPVASDDGGIMTNDDGAIIISG